MLYTLVIQSNPAKWFSVSEIHDEDFSEVINLQVVPGKLLGLDHVKIGKGQGVKQSKVMMNGRKFEMTQK